MLRRFIRWIRRELTADKLFFQNFTLLFLAMTVVFSVFAVYTYRNSRRIIETEFTSANLQDLQNTTEYVDGLIMETRYMIAALITNDTTKFFFTTPTPETIWGDYSTQMRSHLRALKNSREAIENICLYSSVSDSIYSVVGHFEAATYDDRFWLEQLQADQNGFSIFPYASHGRFPYVICVAKEFTVNGDRGAVAIMLDLSKVSFLASMDGAHHQEVFLVSDQQEILYRDRQEALTEPLQTVPVLAHYLPDTPSDSRIVADNGKVFSFAQQHSSDYPWSYVLVTHLDNYTARLSTQNALLFATSTALILFAVLFAVFFALRALKPIRNIRSYLDSPEMLAAAQSDDSADIQYIAGKFTQYVQTNHLLREELQQRLDLLNQTQILALQSQINPHFLSNTLNMIYLQAIDALGYEHSLPLMILDTSKLIRYAIEPAKMVTLETELSQTGIYLNLLKQRYEKNIVIAQEISPDTLSATVPRLFLQPIIENAVFHGFSQYHDTECRILIRCFRKQRSEPMGSADDIYVQILDNGGGIPPEKLEELKRSLQTDHLTPGKSIGLRNVVQRMNLIYSDQFSLTIESTPETGTCFTLCFPYLE